MNLDWILNPLTLYGAFALGGLAGLCLAAAIKIEMRAQHKRHRIEHFALEEALSSLQARVHELQTESRDRGAAVAPALTQGVNLHKRAEALRMYRRGCDSHTVSATLGLPRADVDLLQKVQKILTSPAGEPVRSRA